MPRGFKKVASHGSFAYRIGSTAAQIAKEQGVRFNLIKLDWIGRVAGEPKVWVVRCSLKSIRSVKGFLNSEKTCRWGATGPGASEYLEGNILQAALHREFHFTTGFDASTGIAASVDRKEVDIFSGSVVPSAQHQERR